MAKRVYGQMAEAGRPAADFISAEDLLGVDDGALEALCRAVVEANPKSAADYRAGKEKALKALVGAVMRETKGRADALKAEALIKKLIADLS
jgi:aspartyl-tRNA(Asn)/glutamyl-tRNA(Gln) amidotransferase subunit B